MQHYFGTIVDGHAILDSAQRHHLIDVRRANCGEKIEIADGTDIFLCQINSLDPLDIVVVDKTVFRRELDNHITVAFATLKGDHNDLIVLKGTELGASRFIPFVCERTIVRPKEKEDKKLLRLRKIAEEGSEQSRRSIVPTVEPYMDFKDVVDLSADIKIFAYEGEAGSESTLLSVAEGIEKNQSVLIVIGPEGGFTENEVKVADDCGFTFVSLGRRILRAETAALYAVSILSATSEKKG
ncbi:MAG: 16S rRNA (uracil(1498)-N(3))-methyltransferase [Bacilli bacterium]|nr:16S rRNA (uracil(1498)-N(3))-methyltransferase [Bacilli bacterium]